MRVLAVATFCSLASASVAFAAEVPDMRGDWVGKTQPIVAGRGGPHWPESRGTFDKPALFERDMTIRVTGQDGRRFWGQSIVGGDPSVGGKATSEPFIGSVSTSGEKVMMADTDGYFFGELSGNILSYCYVQAGAKQDGAQPAVVTCLEVTKK